MSHQETIWGNGSTVKWGDQLEGFFEVNEVGIDDLSYWKDEEMAETSYYDLLSWYKVETFFTDFAFNMKEASRSKPVILKKDLDFFRSMYWSWGGNFRYDLPV